MGRPCKCCKKKKPPKEDFAFIIIMIIDESSEYSGEFFDKSDWNNEFGPDPAAVFNADLEQLRRVERRIGNVNIILLQPCWGHQTGTLRGYNGQGCQFDLFGNNPIPEEVIFYSEMGRYVPFAFNQCNPDPNISLHNLQHDRGVFSDFTNNIIRDTYACIGIGIDVSGSMTRGTVGCVLDDWYCNISVDATGLDPLDDPCLERLLWFQRYLEPLQPCSSGSLDFNQANGCVQEIPFPTERWLREAANIAEQLFDLGCVRQIIS